MSEPIDSSNIAPRFSWSRALTAGLIATVIMTVVLVLTGMNIMKMLGSMIAPGAGVPMQYIIGGAMHLMIGLFYGVAYARLVGRVTEWNRFVKGAVYGLAIAAIAFAVMPVMSAVMGGGEGARNPCGGAGANPCASAHSTNPCTSTAANPCAAKNPCAAQNPCAPQNPCAAQNPCATTRSSAGNPCGAKNPCGARNPCAAKNPCTAKNPCAAKQAGGTSNACHMAGGSNPCGGAANPCGGSQGPYSGAISMLNHLVYALTLAFAYGGGRSIR